MKKTPIALLSILILGLSFFGCSSSQEQVVSLQSDVDKKTTEIETLKSQLNSKDASLNQLEEEVGSIKKENEELKKSSSTVGETTTTTITGADELFPPNAKPGECYARVLIPATYKTTTEDVLLKETSEVLEIIPAKYEWVTERVLVKEASTKLVEVPETYKWVEEKVLVKPASTILEKVPAKYDWQEEKILEKPAHTVWKKGNGLIEKVDNTTGEIMCLVEVPAQYKTIKKRVLISPETTRTIEISAEYETVKVKRIDTEATTRTIEAPAEYKTLRVRKEVSPATTRKTTIPAEFQKVTKNVKITEEKMEWKAVLCETNSTPNLISQIQRALLKAGHNPGPIDGIIGSQTQKAISSYQKANKLAVGGITQETLKKLGL